MPDVLNDLLPANHTENAYSPDRNSPMSGENTIRYHIPPNKRLKLSFGFNATFENSIIIYDHELNELTRRDNRQNGNSDWITSMNHTHSYIRIYITGWHKNPSETFWAPSGFKELGHNQDYVSFGFEDQTDNDFNDASVTIVVID